MMVIDKITSLYTSTTQSLHELFNILSLSDGYVIKSSRMMIICINGASIVVVSIFVFVSMFWTKSLYHVILNKNCHCHSLYRLMKRGFQPVR